MTRRPTTGETLAEHFARLTERIRELETQIRDLADQNAALRREVDFVTERERDAHQDDR